MAEHRERWSAWLEDKEDELVHLWTANPCLYDASSKDYCNKYLRQKTMTEIAKVLYVSGEFNVIFIINL